MRFSSLVSALVATTALAACIPQHRVRPESSAARQSRNEFRHSKYPYLIKYKSGVTPGLAAVVGDAWIVENLYKRGNRWVPKAGKERWNTSRFDADGDGRVDAVLRTPVEDLAFEHLRTDAQISLSTFPVDSRTYYKALRVIARRTLHGFAITGGEDSPLARANERTATKVVFADNCKVSGVDSFFVDFEIHNLDQVQVEQDVVWKKVRAVFIRAPFDTSLSSSMQHYRKRDRRPGRQGAKEERAHVMMFASYENFPEDFDDQLPEFEGMLDRLVLGRAKKQIPNAQPTTCRRDANAPSSGTRPAPVAPPSSAPPTSGAPAPTADPDGAELL